MPSSAMFTTPDRSENNPPSAARISGVDNRIVDQNSWAETISDRQSSKSQLPEETPEHCFGRHEQNDRGLQNLNDVFRHVLREGIDGNPAAREDREQKRRHEHTGRMIPAEEGHRD